MHSMLPNSPQAHAARRICDILHSGGHRALLAGGCVRDILLAATPKDYDIATSARPETVAKLFDKTTGVGATFGVMMVHLPEGCFEVATFRKDGPYLDGRRPSNVVFVDEREDAQRRDFTINALFLDPQINEVLDYVRGEADLKLGIVRTVGSPRARFEEDHLRLLRAVRFAARLGYRIENETFKSIRGMANYATATSPERIRVELLKILCEGSPRRGFELLDATDLLEAVLPEIAAMKGIQQPPEFHPEGDVFTHTLLILEQLRNPSPTLAMGALLHDVGKPGTQTFEDRIRFNGHPKVGSHIARSICHRLRFPNEETERIVWLVGQHMRLMSLLDMRESKRKRLLREPGFDELLELARIDCLASHGKLDTFQRTKEYRDNLKPEEVRPKPLLSGTDLIALGYVPGPLFSEILGDIEDAQLEGTLCTRESALSFLQERWPTTQSP